MLTLGSHAQTVRYVKVDGTGDGLSWANASSDLQAMINADGVQQVWVAAGTYKPIRAADGTLNPGNIRATSFKMKNGVAIYGGFAGGETTLNGRNWRTNPTVLSGEHQGDDDIENNSCNVVLNFDNGLSSTAVLDGFTITGGNANGAFIISAYGGGIYNYEAGSPTIINCTFFKNKANIGGGMYNFKSSTNLINCVFIGNQAGFGGAMSNIEASPSVVNCSFSGNRANTNGGGAVRSATNSSPSFKNCILWGNSSEIYNDESSTATYTNTLVKGLVAGGFQGTEDPLFVSQPAVGLGTSGDLRLQACSPAINAGSNTDNTVTIDLDGNPRKVGVIDLGAYEYQSVPMAISPTVETSNPTTCGGSNGNITLSGFLSNTLYSVAYKKDNTAVSAANFTSNSNGVITLTSLGAGNYTDIVATYGSCVSQAVTANLQVPAKPAVALSAIPAICAGATSFTIPYGNETGSPNKYSISETGIVAVSDGDLSNPITVALSSPASGSSISFKLTVKNAATSCESSTITGSVTVNPVSVGGTVSSAQTICSGASPADLSLSGQTGSVVKWQKSSDANFSNAVDIASTATTLLSATIGNLTADTYFRAVVKSGVCSEAISSSVKITVNPVSVGGVVSSAQTICSGASPADLSLSGQTGSVVKWQKSSDANFSTPVDIVLTATTLPSATIGALTADTYFRAVVKSGVCNEAYSSSVLIQIHRKPTITLSMLQQTFNEGNNQTFCDTDANPVNSLQFNLTNGCAVGTPVWRVQVGSGAWSDWSPNAPVTQLSNNQPHRYQAACDASCPATYTSLITVQINYRASTPQQVSLVADGVTVSEGETKEVCNIEGNALIFNATCVSGEVVLYSVDGGDYNSVVPTQLVDGQFHNYRVRCRKSDGIPSCIETESGVMRLKMTNGLEQVPVASLNVTSGCGTPVSFSGTASCGSLTTVWYNSTTNVALATLPSQTPTETTSYYARCQAGGGCLSEKSNVVTYTVIPVGVAPVVTALQEIVCTGTSVTISANCPAGSTTSWNTGVTTPSFEVSFSNVTKQTYWAKCVFSGGCQSAESVKKEVYWNAFVVTLINVGQSKSAVKPANDKALWSSQFITKDGGPELAQSTQSNPIRRCIMRRM